jgi:enhancer of mRNA-decapping protein 4
LTFVFLNRIREIIQSIIRDEITNTIRELLTTQKNEINTLIIQQLRQQQQQSITPKLQPTVVNQISPPKPPPTVDIKQQNALKLARSGQLNQAFEYVLSASDLNLVLYLCENVRSAELFSIQPCPLQIPVILSLIQQLAADLTTHQELKYR